MSPRVVGEGAFAYVFDLGDNTVVKAYKRIPQTADEVVLDWDDHEFIIRQLCAVEMRAYDCLTEIPEVAPHIPTFLGPVDVHALGLVSPDPRWPLVPGCAFRLERIQGEDCKVALLPSPLREEVSDLLERIEDLVGNVNALDSSCFVPGTRATFAVIDFALWDGWIDAQTLLGEHGTLSQDDRARIAIG